MPDLEHTTNPPDDEFAEQPGYGPVNVLAPRIELNEFRGRYLMIHEGGDNYSDEPKLGGGGKRVACGVVSGLTSQ